MAISNQVLFNSFLDTTKNYFNKDMDINIIGAGELCMALDALKLFDMTAIINGKAAFFGSILFSAEDSLVSKIFDVFLGDCEIDCDLLEIKKDTIGELLNILVGHMLSHASCFVEDVTFSVPFVFNKQFHISSKKGQIMSRILETKFGFFTIAYSESNLLC